jgi:hypothetical protein
VWWLFLVWGTAYGGDSAKEGTVSMVTFSAWRHTILSRYPQYSRINLQHGGTRQSEPNCHEAAPLRLLEGAWSAVNQSIKMQHLVCRRNSQSSDACARTCPRVFHFATWPLVKYFEMTKLGIWCQEFPSRRRQHVMHIIASLNQPFNFVWLLILFWLALLPPHHRDDMFGDESG